MSGFMSRKGDGGDHAPTERGVYRSTPARVFGDYVATRVAMTTMTFEDIDVSDNRRRRHSTLGYTIPDRRS
jgi:hypothetical protein